MRSFVKFACILWFFLFFTPSSSSIGVSRETDQQSMSLFGLLENILNWIFRLIAEIFRQDITTKRPMTTTTKMPITDNCSTLSKNYNYYEKGPDYWNLACATCRDGMQSPIVIQTDKTVFNNKLKPFNFFGYDRILKWYLHLKVDHNVKIDHFDEDLNEVEDMNSSVEYDVGFTGSDFNDTYYLDSLHFHWGEKAPNGVYTGSEHTIGHTLDGIQYPLELHLVHKTNSSKIAVLGFLIYASIKENSNIKNLTTAFKKITPGNPKSYETYFSLDSLIQLNDAGSYYRYMGSFTSPPCTSGVTWTIFTSAINFSEEQIYIFTNSSIQRNFRPPQPLNNRNVYQSF